ncbi:nitroreductase family protein [Latilactobacillus sakei]|uniref:nitroreductase family protein n=1 Tax=Latilactobacillus sakei TaxID=1599 RepID=UPI00202AEB32|nr:nitroreductase family protein [Latilactobacillus sakei]
MEFNDVINNRKSIRSFDPHKTVSDELIKKIITSAQRTPSWTNYRHGRIHNLGEFTWQLVEHLLVSKQITLNGRKIRLRAILI